MRPLALLPLLLLPVATAVPPATTTACPLLDGLKCSNPPLVAPGGGVVPCSVDGDTADATACQYGRRLLDPGADCPGSTYVSKDANGQWHCGGAGACTEWVRAAEWTTQTVNPDPCPIVPASADPIAIAAAASTTSQTQGGLLSIMVTISRPADSRRKMEEQARRRTLWGNTKSKVPVNYALRLDLPSRLNATVKHVSIWPTIKPWADKTPQVVGESLLWPRVPMGEDAKRATKRKFKALIRIRSGVNNLGPMTFTATVYHLDVNTGVVTDLQQASATIQVTPGKSLLGGF